MSRRPPLLIVVGCLGLAGLAVAACSSDDTAAPVSSTIAPTPVVATTVAASVDSAPATTATTDPPASIAATTTTLPETRRSWHLVGDADPAPPQGASGELSALPAGPTQLVRGFDGIANVQFPLVPFVVSNRTTSDVEAYRLEVTATDPATGTQYVGTVAAMTPSRLDAGEWGLAAVEFLSVDQLPEGITFDISIGPADVPPTAEVDASTSFVDLEISGLLPGKLPHTGRAFVINSSDSVVSIPFTFVRYCVEGDAITASEFQLPGDELHEHDFVPRDVATVVFARPDGCSSILVGAVSFVR